MLRLGLLRLGLLVSAVFASVACGHAPPNAPPPPQAVVPPAAKQKVASFGVAGIDKALRTAWQKENLTPAPPADDATFLRRAYIDIVGTIPPAEVTRVFLASDAPDKRRKLVDRLLDSPEYAEHWMNYWDDVLMGRELKGGQGVDRVAFRSWLRARFEANAPWDRVVRDLVSATGQNSIGGERVNVAKALAVPLGSRVPKKGDEDGIDLDRINGAVNWTLRFEQTPKDLAGSASRVFLGVQIQCAECHDHKTEKWKQDDFRSFASAFFHQRAVPLDPKKNMGVQKRFEISDLDRVAPRFAKNPELESIARSKARALDGTDLEKGKDTRKALAEWMTSAKNPWFAKALVNRMWGHFLGRGFYDPVDDMRATNEPVLTEVLDQVSADFAARDFDLKELIRTITSTEAYALSASPNAKTDPENKLWARFRLVPLGPEELMNALLYATNIEDAASQAGIRNIDALRTQLVRQYGFLFDIDEADDVPDYSGTVSQALALLNGQLVGQGSRALPASGVATILAKAGSDEDKIEELTVRVLGRKPTAEERTQWVNYVQVAAKTPPPTISPPKAGSGGAGPLGRLANRGSDPRRAAYEDVMWALLNSSEFSFNH